ncbi:hypothetical protein ACN1NW_000459 [Acinetobacter baumannii]|nr:hypothetical protein [Acinetobacter baumannii]ELA7031041.1 hypothetical protein [Acinetobacter baumannii]ELA7118804.1 hypothetical protein [Acinetobacter baumannii]ELB0919754.1 hypothetical protein [Acinetobacter baumannii]ELB0965931.1 hypothetical protein [Acinetobacter baumannii]
MSDAAIQQLQAQVTDLTSKVTSQGQEIAQLKQASNSNASAISTLSNTVSSLDARVTRLGG